MKIKQTGIGKLIETDVLILGAGAAGSGAAIAARRQGADVVLVEKGKLESCGSAGGGNDHFLAVLERLILQIRGKLSSNFSASRSQDSPRT